MKWSGAAERRVEDYLGAVEKHLAHKPAGVRRDVVGGLRNQIAEALRRLDPAGGEIGLETVERVLAEMDPPETFAEAAVEVAAETAVAVAPKLARGGSSRWFWLGLAFLLVNAYGVWKTTRPEAPFAPPAESPAVAEPPKVFERVLRLRSVEQVDVSADREVTLRLAFSDEPDRNQLTRFFRLAAPGQGEVKYWLMGAAGGGAVLIETEPVLVDSLEYVLEPGLPSVGGAKPEDQPRRGTLAMTMNLALRGLKADTPSFDAPELWADFTAFPDANGLKDFVAVEPATEFTVEAVDEWRRSGLVLRGAFRPGEIYEVTFKQGLPAANGSSLPQEIRRSVQFPLPKPAIRFDAPGRYLSPRGTLSVPVAAVNLEKYVARLRPVFANNLVELARRESQWSYYGSLTADLDGPTKTATNALAPTRNGGPARGAVDLRALAGGEPRGAYWLEVAGEKAGGDDRLIVVTDLGIAARTYSGGALIWVNSLRTAQPAAGAAVAVYARNNQVLARGTVDGQGLVSLAWETGEGAAPFVVVAELDGDLSYLDLARTGVDQGEGLGGAPYLEAGQLEAAVFSDRGVYRPGEKIFMQAIARDDRRQAPEPFPALLRVRRPDGRIFRDVPVELDAFGSATAEVEMPEYLPTGRYGLELAMPGTFTVLGETSVALEDFVPPQIRVAVKPPEGRGQAGDVLAFGVNAAHLFGRPAAGLKATGAATFKPAPFAPSNWPGWRFGDDEKAFAPVYRPLGARVLDENGHAEFEAESRAAWRPPAALQLVQQATVLETGGRAVTAYASSLLDPYPFYVGLKTAWEGAVRAGETQRVAVVEVRPDGAPVAEARPLVLTLSRVTWNSVLRRNSNGRYEWKSERQVVEIRKDTLAAGGEAQDWAFAVDGAGDYLLVAADPASGSSTRIEFHAGSADPAWLAWSREKPGRVELAWDKETYRPGETARLQVRAPFAGPALLTVETDRVREARTVRLEKNTAEFDVPVTADYAPNAYCSLTLIRPAEAEEVWSAHRAVGALALPVALPGTRLEVSLAAPAVARPQAALEAVVTVRDEAGNPARGAVTVLAVDEAICMLTAFATPDPDRTFAAQRALGVSPFDLYAELMPVAEEQMEGVPTPGGDGGDALRRRLNPIKANRFKPVALWQAALALDTNGQAAVRLDLPEFNGELRLMAVAYDATQAGSTSLPVKVKRDLVVQPALPRFLAIGDRCEASVALYNEGKAPLTVQVRATCGGPLRAETAEQTIEITAGGSANVALPLTAGPGPGKALCTLEVEAGADSFRETIELAVRPAAGSRVAVISRVLAAGESATLEPPAGWLPESVSMAGTLSTLPSLQLGRALDYVVHYPYGCLEQTVSGAFPLLYAGDWAQRLLPGSRAIGDVAAFVPAAIRRVLAMQQENGGFSTWPFHRGTADDTSIYAVHFLVEAKAAGFDVPADRLAAALAWVRGRLDRTLAPDADEGEWILEMQARAYLCHVLALAGRPDAGWNARLREQSARLNFAARAHAAAALLLAGEPRGALPLMESMVLPVARSRVPGRLLDSDVRDAALLLSAWLDVEPENAAVARLAQYLRDRQQDGHWGNTQDDALALLAFGKLARHLPDEEQPFAGKLELPGGDVRAFAGTNDVAWSREPGAGGVATVKNDGPGKLYLGARFEGVSAEPEPERSDSVAIHRDFLDQAGNAVDASALPQGELIVVRLTVETKGRRLDQLVLEDLLPAGWEIENPNLATSQQFGWLREKNEGDLHREARDDRMLIFTGPILGEAAFHYAVRATTPGTYALPPPTVAGMYEPEIRGVGVGGQVRVGP
ncbi:MAG: alpha-2-macroglobulin [Kiritimatiellia bacterium]